MIFFFTPCELHFVFAAALGNLLKLVVSHTRSTTPLTTVLEDLRDECWWIKRAVFMVKSFGKPSNRIPVRCVCIVKLLALTSRWEFDICFAQAYFLDLNTIKKSLLWAIMHESRPAIGKLCVRRERPQIYGRPIRLEAVPLLGRDLYFIACNAKSFYRATKECRNDNERQEIETKASQRWSKYWRRASMQYLDARCLLDVDYARPVISYGALCLLYSMEDNSQTLRDTSRSR